MKKIIKPAHLQKGDIIGLISPSAPLAGMLPHRTQKGIFMLEKLGYGVEIGKHASTVTDHTAGSGEERAQDINAFFRDPRVKAIISFIGGNHSSQVLKYLDFELIKNNPKILMGYSDNTVLELAILTQTGLVTFYGPSVLNQFAENPDILPYTEEYFKKAVTSNQPIGTIIPSSKWTDEILDWFKKDDQKRARKMKVNNGWQWLSDGKTEGPLLGGCIASLMHLRGTRYWPNFSGSILFWETSESSEDFTKGEKVENIDSYLSDLELSGVFNEINGMIIGRPFGYTQRQSEMLVHIIKERTKGYTFPILYNVDFGHTDPMITIPIGVMGRINSYSDEFTILGSGVH